MPETNDKLEAVAKAIFAVSDDPAKTGGWAGISEEWRDDVREHARAAIRAMRDWPTPGKITVTAPKGERIVLTHPAPRDLWRSLLDLALAPPKANG